MVGEKIKFLRVQKNMSQEALAKALFFSNRTISNWENNLREVSTENLKKIAKYFNVPLQYFLQSTEVIPTPKGAYQQVKTKKIAISDKYFYSIFVLLLIQTSLLWIPLFNRLLFAALSLLFWIGVMITSLIRYTYYDRIRVKSFFVPLDAKLYFQTKLSNEGRKQYAVVNLFQYLSLIIISFFFYLAVFGLVNLRPEDDFLNVLIIVFVFSTTGFHLLVIIKNLTSGLPKKEMPYMKDRYDFDMLLHRAIVSLHYGMTIFLVVYLNIYSQSDYPSSLLMFALVNGLSMLALLRVLLVSNAKFYDSYSLYCHYIDSNQVEILR
jgi:transcriptional regulator with XRE-family HTH domain